MWWKYLDRKRRYSLNTKLKTAPSGDWNLLPLLILIGLHSVSRVRFPHLLHRENICQMGQFAGELWTEDCRPPVVTLTFAHLQTLKAEVERKVWCTNASVAAKLCDPWQRVTDAAWFLKLLTSKLNYQTHIGKQRKVFLVFHFVLLIRFSPVGIMSADFLSVVILSDRHPSTYNEDEPPGSSRQSRRKQKHTTLLVSFRYGGKG